MCIQDEKVSHGFMKMSKLILHSQCRMAIMVRLNCKNERYPFLKEFFFFCFTMLFSQRIVGWEVGCGGMGYVHVPRD